MGTPTGWGQSARGQGPRESIEAQCRRRGRGTVVTGCIELLAGRDAEPEFVLALGGPPAAWVADGGEPGPAYWLRVWAARGLLWVWDDSALPALTVALSDEAWRVREMAAKVVARHRLDDALPVVAALREDPVPRVRAAAARALARLTDPGAGGTRGAQ